MPDMRKALRRDVSKKSVVPLKHPITPDQLEWFLTLIVGVDLNKV
jgi:hypothetical protein